MGHHSVFWIFFILSFMLWYACVFTTKRLIERNEFSKKNYPKGYILPGRRMRKIFDLPHKRKIPKWCYYQLMISFVPIVLFLISTTLYFSISDIRLKFFIAQLFWIIYWIVAGVDMTYFMVNAFIYKV